MSGSHFIRRVKIRNFRSIATCDVQLRRLSILVGQNGAGKSNFLHALGFMAEALRSSLDNSLRVHGGIKEVRRRSGGRPTDFGMWVHFSLDDGREGRYGFEIGARADETYEIKKEVCSIQAGPLFGKNASFHVEGGRVVSSTLPVPPKSSPDRLYLVSVSGFEEFRGAYDALEGIRLYNLSPNRIRIPHPSDSEGGVLLPDGSNLPRVFAAVEKHPEIRRKILEYLALVVPGIQDVQVQPVGPYESLEFHQATRGEKQAPWTFYSTNMSDGTLRALGILVALNQVPDGSVRPPQLIGIEEPEAALHPMAAGILMECLQDASELRQVVVTTHSPELLDSEGVEADSILAVVLNEGTTRIGPLSKVMRGILRDHVATAGELLTQGQFEPEDVALDGSQFSLFAE